MIESRAMKWVGHIECTREKKGTQKIDRIPCRKEITRRA
jgi:hypothetical protein